jgi:hypothetical protein
MTKLMVAFHNFANAPENDTLSVFVNIRLTFLMASIISKFVILCYYNRYLNHFPFIGWFNLHVLHLRPFSMFVIFVCNCLCYIVTVFIA